MRFEREREREREVIITSIDHTKVTARAFAYRRGTYVEGNATNVKIAVAPFVVLLLLLLSQM